MSRAYYASILGVSPNAGEAEVKAAFRRMVKKFHPDINPEPFARERFLELKKAYDYLLNPEPYISSSTIPPAQKREEEEKKKREQRMKRAREIRKKKEEAERLAWEKFKGSFSMWAVVFIVLCFYFSVMMVCINSIQEYPYPDRDVKEPEFALGISVLVILGFTYGLYKFFNFLRR